jgi:MFS family permease
MKKSKAFECNPSRQSLFALDGLNFFLADVRDGVGPYLAIFLLTTRKWNATDIGIAVSAMGIATLIAQTPAGAWMDRSRQKRIITSVAAAAVALACVLMTFFTSFAGIVAMQVICGIAAAFLAPGIASLTLGLVGHKQLSNRTGRNEGFNHAGNVFAAVAAGALGYYVSQSWIFYLVSFMSAASIVATLCIKPEEVNHEVARGLNAECDDEKNNSPATVWDLFKDKALLFFTAAMMLFHFANAAMLPLVGQLISKDKGDAAPVYMSACIVIAQLVMIPVALLAGRLAETWGRKPIFLIALAVLPIRGVLYTFFDNAYYLVGVQALDGIGAGIFGVLSILTIADLTEGKGRFNLASGALATAVGIGASLSNGIAGFIVDKAGYSTAFLFLAVLAAIALVVFFFFVPETKPTVQKNATPHAA